MLNKWKQQTGNAKTDERLREKYGIIGGVAGIFINAVIFLIEVFVGTFTKSVAITADAFHNLTDVVSSLITIASFKFASKPADREHPFGHGRIEYLSGLLVSFIIMLIGFEFLKSSIGKIIHPTPVTFSLLSLILILLAIPLKVLLSLFNRKLAKMIDSTTLKATSFDALSDVFVLAVASVSLITASFTKAPVDGYLGVVVAFFIMYSSFTIAKSALNPLLGTPPDPKIVREIVNGLLQFEYITGVHDLVIHNYGPGKYMASIHAEVPSNIPVMTLHETIDEAEQSLSQKYGILLVIHMDPLNRDDEEVKSAKADLLSAIAGIDVIKSIHDFRIVGKGQKKNLIFDAVVDNDRIKTEADEKKLRGQINASLHQIRPLYQAVVNIDRNYVEI